MASTAGWNESFKAEDDNDDIEVVGGQLKRIYRCKICEEVSTSVFQFLHHFKTKHQEDKNGIEQAPSTLGKGSKNPEIVIEPTTEEPSLSNEAPLDSVEERNPNEESGYKDNSAEKPTSSAIGKSFPEETPSPEILDYLGLRKIVPGTSRPEAELTVPTNFDFHCLNCPMKFTTVDSLKEHAIRIHIFPIALAEATIARTRIKRTKSGQRKGSPKLHCICKQKFNRKMIGCSNEHCKIQWFHFTCVGIKTKPKGKWYCRTCRKKLKV